MSVVHLRQWLDTQSSHPATVGDVEIMSAHVVRCAACRLLLSSDEEIRRRLALLRMGEPRINVLRQVMRRIGEIEPN